MCDDLTKVGDVPTAVLENLRTRRPDLADINELIRDYAKSVPRVKYLDASKISLGADGLPQGNLFVEDKLHLNAEGYKRLAEKVRAFLDKELPLQ
jgi:lysophospholipase L1-like esterase